ncbi:MAG TPA: CvpA family protein, partial [Burkholderiaceae bacterium]
MTINWIDLLLLIFLLLSLYGGWRRGFVRESLDLAAWLAALWLAIVYYQPLARWLGPRASWATDWDRPAAFLGLFVLGMLALQLFGRILAAALPARAHLHAGNKLLGLAPGLAHGLINVIVMSALLLALPLPLPVQDQARGSDLVNRFAGYAQSAEAMLRPVFDDAIGATMNLLTVKPQSSETVRLPFTETAVRPQPELEAQMLALVNQERAAAGLRPVAADPLITPVARAHSTDMLARGYFSHITPEGKDPFDRLRAGKVG